jgi:hypothetical protein
MDTIRDGNMPLADLHRRSRDDDEDCPGSHVEHSPRYEFRARHIQMMALGAFHTIVIDFKVLQWRAVCFSSRARPCTPVDLFPCGWLPASWALSLMLSWYELVIRH